jgi:hypothetical protein
MLQRCTTVCSRFPLVGACCSAIRQPVVLRRRRYRRKDRTRAAVRSGSTWDARASAVGAGRYRSAGKHPIDLGFSPRGRTRKMYVLTVPGRIRESRIFPCEDVRLPAVISGLAWPAVTRSPTTAAMPPPPFSTPPTTRRRVRAVLRAGSDVPELTHAKNLRRPLGSITIGHPGVPVLRIPSRWRVPLCGSPVRTGRWSG